MTINNKKEKEITEIMVKEYLNKVIKEKRLKNDKKYK
jgi:hypothetical protein